MRIIATLDEKKALLIFVFSNLKINGGKAVPTPHNGFEAIALRAKDGNWLADVDVIRTFYQKIEEGFYIPNFA